MKKIFTLLLILPMILTSCNKEATQAMNNNSQSFNDSKTITSNIDDFTYNNNSSSNVQNTPQNISLPLKPYTDIRQTFSSESKIFQVGEFDPKDIITFTFNEGTVLKGSEGLQKKILENGKNPGLLIKSLHEKGITGEGVNVGIIDQNLLINHPEFKDKIKEYYDTGCNMPDIIGSMHGPAVISILAGDTIGVAPEANVYYAAVPSWLGDSKYYADGLNWIIDQNKNLPESEKIRVVSVSASPSGDNFSFTKNQELWDKAVLNAQNEGILVIDYSENDKTHFITAAYYDPQNPDDITLCKAGYPSSPSSLPNKNLIGVPCSFRTVAEEYVTGICSYEYFGQGGLSFAVPYAAGVLALGWQVNPDLDKDTIMKLLFDTCYINRDGSRIINPSAFIDRINGLK